MVSLARLVSQLLPILLRSRLAHQVRVAMSLGIGLLNGLSIGLTYAEADGHHVVMDILLFRFILSWGEPAEI